MNLGIEGHISSSVSLSVRSGFSRRLAAFCSLSALLLIATLIGPSTFLIAKKATAVSHGIQISETHVVGSTDKKDGDSKSPGNPKRPKGTLHSNGKIGNIFVFVAPPGEDVGTRIVETEPSIPTIFATEAEPKNNVLTPQLLQRPPPTSSQ